MANVIQQERFFMPMSRIPSGTAQQRKAAYDRTTGTIRTYPSESYRHAKKVLTNALKHHKPAKPFKGAVLLDVEYRYETKDKKKIGTFKTSRPDGDNLLKVLKDCMIGYFFDDDSQVCVEAISRFWVEAGKGGIFIRVSEIEKEVY